MYWLFGVVDELEFPSHVFDKLFLRATGLNSYLVRSDVFDESLVLAGCSYCDMAPY